MKAYTYLIVVFSFLVVCQRAYGQATISGPTSMCATYSAVYTLSNGPAATSGYTWTVTSGSISSGQGTKTVTVSFYGPGVGRTLQVSGNGVSVSTQVNIYQTTTPMPISGPTSVCAGGSATYTSAITVPWYTSTSWVATNTTGGTIVSQSNSSFTINFPSNYTGGQIVFYGVFGSCGAGPAATLNITANGSTPPGAAGEISGPTKITPNTNGLIYQVPSISGATGYQWILPSGATIASGTNTNVISVNFGSGFNGGRIVARGTNATCSGSASSLMLTKCSNTTAAGTITGITPVCQGQKDVLYSVPIMSNAVEYVWTLLDGQQQITSTNSITVNYSATAVNGSISVFGRDAEGCGGPASTKAITVNPIPVLTQQPLNAPLTLGGNVTFAVATGGSGLTYQWKKNGTNISGATLSSYSLTNLTLGHQGNYQVVVSSGIGCSTTSHTARLYANVEDQFSENYIITKVITKDNVSNESSLPALTPNEMQMSIAYFDDLGRPLQQVDWKRSPTQKDVIQPVVYDAYGRENLKYLPFVLNDATGLYKDVSLKTDKDYTHNFYDNATYVAHDDRPFTEVVFEASPLNRPAKQYGPGKDWSQAMNNKYVEHQYLSNIHGAGVSTSEEKVIAWTVNSSNVPVRATMLTGFIVTGGYYEKGQLTINLTFDEHRNIVREYTNIQGQVILKKVQATAAGANNLNDLSSTTPGWALTYYVYDDFGNLRFVLPPELSKLIHQNDASAYNPSTSELNNWAFQYKYDGRRRMIEKLVPGAKPIYMVYDKHDRLVMTQDGNQRAGTTKYWSFTKYDALNRPVLSGITISSNDRVQMQTAVDNYYTNLTPLQAWFETFIGDQANDVHLYDNKSYPQEINENNYLTVTYYDNYSFRSTWIGNYSYLDENLSEVNNGTTYNQPDTENTRVVGQVTGTKTKVLDGGVTGGYTWLKGVTYYDEKYRPVQMLTDNYTGGVDRFTTVYDFVGKELKTKLDHSETAPSFKDIVAVAISGNKMVCIAAPTNWGFSGLASVEQLGAGQNGWVEVVASETNLDRAFGLSQTNNSPGLDIGYAIRIASNGTLMVYEGGTLKHNVPGTYAAGDVLRVERNGSTVVYKKNGTTIYTSQIASTSALLADVAFRHASATLVGLKCSFAKSDQTITRRFEYDHASRLIKTRHKLNNGDEILLALNEYNELGQLVDKKLHSTVSTGADAKQSVDYQYNIRGWLTKMNESDVSVLAAGDTVKDLFGFELAYNNDLGTGNANANPSLDLRQYNGNISAMKWSNSLSLGSVKENAYNYSYDPLNRLKTATFREKTSTWSTPANNAFVESGFNYDLNGNITSLTRNDKRATGWMDNLVFTYTHATEGASNKLRKVTDSGDDFKGFIDGNAGSTDDYKYDDNGNLTHDLNKGIGTSLTDATNKITYNFLNLPETVTKGNNSIRYIYDAAGRKLSQVTTFGGQVKQADYVGEFQYENGVLQFISHEEGRIVVSKSETILTDDCGSLDNMTASTSTLALVTQNGDQTYVRATSNGTTAKQGIFPIGGSIPVQPGEQYRIRAKGYRTGSNTVHLYIRTNSSDLNWPGAQLANGLAAESYTEQVVTIPAGHTTLQAGVVWNTVTNGQQFFINDFEIIKLSVNSTPEYQYHLKDHLGNTRLTFTSKEEMDDNTATFEAANENTERAEFLRYDNAKRVNATLFDRTNGSSPGYSQRLNGTTNERYGLAKSMMVMPGDVINMEVYAKYVDTNSSNWNTALTNLMTQIAANAAGVVYEGTTYSSSTASFPHAGLLNTSGSTGGPKAYLSYLLFDKNFNYVTGGFKRLSATPKETGQDVAHERLFFDNLTITEAGYLYIYLSNENETPVEVFFDDFTVEHIKSPVVQADDYYPFGLVFNSYSRENSTLNQNLYQGKELQDELGLEIYDFHARGYDPILGRTWQTDPMSEMFYDYSPYSWVKNNPLLRIDPTGMTDFTFNKKTGEVTQVGEANDEPDRILRTNNKGEVKYKKNGEAKVAMGGIEQGILADGQNWKTNDQVIEVGGEGQASVDGVKSFTMGLSEYLGKEIKGFSYSSDASGNVTDMVLGKYLNNSNTESYGTPNALRTKYGADFSLNNITQEFHTHPDGKLGATQSTPSLSQDVTSLQNDRPFIPNASFIILYRIQGQRQPAEYDYTHEYRAPRAPRKKKK